MNEWKKQIYGSIIQTKTVFVSNGGKCFEYKVNSHNNSLETTEPVYLQGQHEEADPLIAFHVKAVTDNILVRSTGTDVLVILLGLVGRSEGIEVIMDYGSSNNSRYIDVSHIACVFNEKQPGFTDALIGLHVLTRCDFTSYFFRIGNMKPFALPEMQIDAGQLNALWSLTSDEVDVPAFTSFLYSLYGFNTTDINEARYKSCMRISCGKGKKPLANL